MSAFVVGADCINRVIFGLQLAAMPRNRYKITAGKNTRKFATLDDAKAVAKAIFDKTGIIVGIEPAETDTEFGRRLLAMNIAAVRQRYNDEEVSGENPSDYTYCEPAPIANCTPAVAAWKAIECYLYQCSEGNIPECELFQLVESYNNKLGARILEKRNAGRRQCERYAAIWDMPECNNAPWG